MVFAIAKGVKNKPSVVSSFFPKKLASYPVVMYRIKLLQGELLDYMRSCCHKEIIVLTIQTLKGQGKSITEFCNVLWVYYVFLSCFVFFVRRDSKIGVILCFCVFLVFCPFGVFCFVKYAWSPQNCTKYWFALVFLILKNHISKFWHGLPCGQRTPIRQVSWDMVWMTLQHHTKIKRE